MRRSAFAFLGIFVLTTSVNIQTASATNKPNKAVVEKSSHPGSSLRSASAANKPKKAAVDKNSSTSLSIQNVSAADKSKKPAVEKSASDLVNEARRWIGTNPTGWERVWCARFMNFVLKRAGYSGTGSDAANSFASYGRRIWWPQVGAIAVMTRGKNGGHVGVVTGVADDGKIIVISGNHNKRVGVGRYPRERIYAYRIPDKTL